MILQRNMSDKAVTKVLGGPTINLEDIIGLRTKNIQVDKHIYDGFIAQDVEEICPQAVSTIHNLKVIDYSIFVPVLFNAFKEYVNRTDSRIKELEEQVKMLINKSVHYKVHRRQSVQNYVAKQDNTKWR